MANDKAYLTGWMHNLIRGLPETPREGMEAFVQGEFREYAQEIAKLSPDARARFERVFLLEQARLMRVLAIWASRMRLAGGVDAKGAYWFEEDCDPDTLRSCSAAL